MVKTVFKLTKSVKSYGNARNKNDLFFGDLGLTFLFLHSGYSIIRSSRHE